VRTDGMPGPLRAFANHQPITQVVDASPSARTAGRPSPGAWAYWWSSCRSLPRSTSAWRPARTNRPGEGETRGRIMRP
jgi:hypothetical protein